MSKKRKLSAKEIAQAKHRRERANAWLEDQKKTDADHAANCIYENFKIIKNNSRQD